MMFQTVKSRWTVMYKGDAGIGYDSGKDFEVTGKAAEYIQSKNDNLRDYLGTLHSDYMKIMQTPSKNGSLHSGIENKVQDMYKPKEKPKPLLEREEIFYREDAA